MELPVWIARGDGTPVKVVHEDTLKRCLSEGWSVIPDPTAQPESVPEVTEAPAEEAAPVKRGKASAKGNDGDADNQSASTDQRSE